MVNKELVKKIREDLKKYSEEEVRKILIKEDYPKERADSVIKAAVEINKQEKNNDKLRKRPFEKKKNNLKLLVFFVIPLILFFSFVMETKNKDFNQKLTFEELISLPYLDYSEEDADETKRGVVLYNKELAFDGYNLYENSLIDMEGDEIHSWPFLIFYGLIDNRGNIISMWNEESKEIIKRDWSSKKIWKKNTEAHHDIAFSGDNTILVPSRNVYKYNKREVYFDSIIELNQEKGKEISRWSTYEHLTELKQFHKPSPLDYLKSFSVHELGSVKEGEDYDYYHLNSIQVLPETDLGKKDKRFQKGNWLLSFRNVNLIAILDKDTEKVVWSWGTEELDKQHSPRMLKNGNILIYDNGFNRGYTRIIEMNPVKREIVWEYKANPPESFYSEIQGYAQRLPNGNTLITESTKGRVFEITKNGTIVWEWFNPQTKDERKRKVVYRMERYPKDYIDKIIELNEK